MAVLFSAMEKDATRMKGAVGEDFRLLVSHFGNDDEEEEFEVATGAYYLWIKYLP